MSKRRCKQYGKAYLTPAQIAERKVEKWRRKDKKMDSLYFTTKNHSSFWNSNPSDNGDYVPPVTDGELSRRQK